MSTKQNLCRHVIFSPNCCFVTNLIDKALVDDSTSNMNALFYLLMCCYGKICSPFAGDVTQTPSKSNNFASNHVTRAMTPKR